MSSVFSVSWRFSLVLIDSLPPIWYNRLMKSIIPVLALITSICSFCMGALCLVLMILIGYIGAPVGLATFVVPCLVTDIVVAALSASTNFFFMKSKICRAGFIISIIDIALIIATFIVMFAF